MWERENESVRHVFENCEINKCKINVEMALKEDGSGMRFIKVIEWLRKITKSRVNELVFKWNKVYFEL